MADHSDMKLGKLPRRKEPKLRRIREYLGLTAAGATSPPVPSAVDRSSDVATWPVLLNDQIGDCTIAAVGHAAQLWMAASGQTVRTMTDAEALAAYEEVSGYVPGQQETDRGAIAVDVLTQWSGAGFRVGGAADMLGGFCALKHDDEGEVRAGVAWLGVVYAGLELPLAARGMDVWDVGTDLSGEYAPGSWGGHAVPVVGYGPWGVVSVSWGQPKRITWAFWRAYASEAYGLLSRDFVSAAVDWTLLEQDMAALREGMA
jgi:hypothetical protein